ncbi:MAG: hypothetical protein ACM359_12975 [Bacillota bacterium]
MEKLNVIAMDRAKFHEELWTFTSQELRIRYALSPYSLEQLCKRHNLPAPPVGYWVKLRHGKKVKLPALPHVSDPALQIVYLLANDLEHGKLCHEPVAVPRTLVEPHPRIAQLCHQFARGDHDHSVPKGQIPCDVGPKARDRALRILDALIKAFEAAGGQLFQGGEELLWGRPPDGVGIAISATSRPDAPDDGLLALTITTNAQVAIRNRWADTNSQDLERSLRPLINAIFESVARIRWERLERECQARQEEKLAALRRAEADSERAKLGEQAFGRQLLDEAKQFHQAGLIRRYARAARRRMAATAQAPEVERWAQRAMRYADTIDPLVQRFPAAAGASAPSPVRVDDLDVTGALRLLLTQSGVTDTEGMFRLVRDQRPGVVDHGLWTEMRQALRICGYAIAGW